MRAKRVQQLGQGLALDREQLEDQQRRNRARVSAVEVAEVVMPGDLAAEDGVLVPHPRLEVRVSDAVHQRRAASALHRVGDRSARAHVVEDGSARLLA